MIQEFSRIKVADNSGALRVKCIKVLGGSFNKCGRIGSIIKVSVIEVSNKNKQDKIKRRSVHYAVIVRTSSDYKRQDGSTIKFDENAVVMLDKNYDIFATRIFGPIPRELKAAGFGKIISLAPEVI